MALLFQLFKNCLVTAVLLILAALPAQSASFTMKRGVNLDMWTTWPDESRWDDPSVILPFPEWRKTIGDAELTALKDAGFDFVRIPVDPSPFLSAKTVALRDQLYADVLESTRMINRAGLKAIVDLHLVTAGSNRSIGMVQVMDDSAMFDAYVDVVRTMGRTLSAEDPNYVAFELMNEPVIECKAADRAWPDRLVQLFAAARASATRLTLILSGGCWGTAEGLVALDPKEIPDDNIIWSFHSYAPFLLTHQGATWAGDFIPYVTGLPYPPHAVSRAELDAALDIIRQRIRDNASWSRRNGMLAYLDEQIATVETREKLEAAMQEPLEAVAKWAKANGITPANIIMGEFGMIRQEYGNPSVIPAQYRAAYYRDMIGLSEKKGFAWAMWSYGGAFGVVDEFEGRKAEPDVLDMVRSLK